MVQLACPIVTVWGPQDRSINPLAGEDGKVSVLPVGGRLWGEWEMSQRGAVPWARHP